jgi:hypothetical protein
VDASHEDSCRGTAWLDHWTTHSDTILELRSGADRLIEETAIEITAHQDASAQRSRIPSFDTGILRACQTHSVSRTPMSSDPVREVQTTKDGEGTRIDAVAAELVSRK